MEREASTFQRRQQTSGLDITEYAAIGYLAGCRREFKSGADLNMKNPLIGLTALHRASLGNHLKVALYLIINGADVNAEDRVMKQTTLPFPFIY